MIGAMRLCAPPRRTPSPLARRRSWLAGYALCAAVAASTALPSAAYADEDAAEAAEARKAYQEGTQAFQAKRYAEAAEKFEQAASKRPHGVPLYTAGLAWESAGKPDRAAEALHRALALPGLDAKQTDDARQRLATLEKSVGAVDVTGEVGAQVRLGDRWDQEVPTRFYAPPGSHDLVVRHPDGTRETAKVKLEAGGVTPFVVKKPEAAAASPEPSPAPTKEPAPARAGGGAWNVPVGLGIAGVGVGALGAGALLGLSALSARDAYDAAPTRESYDHASSLQTWTTVAFVAGGALLAGGIALAVLPLGEGDGGAKVKVAAAPGGFVLGGTFR